MIWDERVKDCEETWQDQILKYLRSNRESRLGYLLSS